MSKTNKIEIKSLFSKEIMKGKRKLLILVKKNRILERSKKARIRNYRINFKFNKIITIKKQKVKKIIMNKINILFSKQVKKRISVIRKRMNKSKQKIKISSKNNRIKVIELEKNEGDNTDLVEINIEGIFKLKIIVDSGATISTLNYREIKNNYPELLNKKYKASESKNIKVALADNSIIKNYGLFYYDIQLDNIWYKVPFILSDSADLLGKQFLTQERVLLDWSEIPTRMIFKSKKNEGEAINDSVIQIEAKSEKWVQLKLTQKSMYYTKSLLVFSKILEEKIADPQIVDAIGYKINIKIKNTKLYSVTYQVGDINLKVQTTTNYDILKFQDEKYLKNFLNNHTIKRFDNIGPLENNELQCFYETNDVFAALNKMTVEEEDSETLGGIDFQINEEGGICIPELDENYENQMIEQAVKNISCEDLKNRLRRCLEARNCISLHGYDMGKTNEEMDIKLKSPVIPNKKIYNLSPKDAQHLKSILEYLLSYNIIKRSEITKGGGSPVFLVPRPSGKASRLVIDSRGYNKFLAGNPCCTMTSTYENLRQNVTGAVRISSLDLTNAFLAIKLSKETVDSGICDIVTSLGQFSFLRGITGQNLTPSFLNAHVSEHLSRNTEGDIDFLDNICGHYDDIQIVSGKHETESDHIDKLITVLTRLHEAGYKVNLAKSKICIDLRKMSIKVLGFELNDQGLKIPPDKLKSITEMPTPTSITEIQSFIGSCVYYRSLIGLEAMNSLNVLSRSFTGGEINWGKTEDYHFNLIKENMIKTDILLKFPDEESMFLIFSDSSCHSLGGVCLSLDLKALKMETEDLGLKIKEINPIFEKHGKKYNIELEEYEQSEGLLELIKEILYSYKLGIQSNNLKKIKTHLINEGIILGGTYCQKMEVEQTLGKREKNMERMKEYNKFVNEINKDQQINSKHKLYEDYIFQALARITGRQILLIIGSKNYVQKKDFVHLGKTTFRNPIIIGYDLDKKSYHWLGLKTTYKCWEPTNFKLIEDMDNRQVISQFFKLIKSKKYTPAIKIVGFYSKSLTLAERSCSIYMLEAVAALNSLEYFAEFTKGFPVLLLTDNKPASDIFNNYTSRKQNKLAKIAQSLILRHPNVSVLAVSGSDQIADFLTRGANPVGKKIIFLNNKKDREEEKPFEEATLYNNLAEFISTSKTILPDPNNSEIQENIKINFLQTDILQNIFQKYLDHINIKKEQEILNFKNKYSKVEGISIKNEVYYKKDKIILPTTLYQIVSLYVHTIYAHRGIEPDYQKILHWYWIEEKMNLKENIKRIHHLCMGCIVGKRLTHKDLTGTAFNSSVTSKGSFIMIDLLERSNDIKPILSEGFVCNILFIKDIFSGYITAYYLKDKTQSTIYLKMLDYFSENGGIKYLLSDNSILFTGKAFKRLSKKYPFIQLYSSPYISKARGAIERVIGSVREQYRVQQGTKSEEGNFADDLPYIVHTMNRIVNPRTGYSPKEIFKGPQNLSFYDENLLDSYFQLKTEAKKSPEQINIECEQMRRVVQRLAYNSYQKHLKSVNKNKRGSRIESGDYVVVKLDGGLRVGELKNKALFTKKPFLVIKVLTHTAHLADIVTKVIIRRHFSQIKKIHFKSALKLELPKELLDVIPMYTIDTLLEGLQERTTEQLTGGGVITRQRKLEENNKNEQEIIDYLSNDLEVGFGDTSIQYI